MKFNIRNKIILITIFIIFILTATLVYANNIITAKNYEENLRFYVSSVSQNINYQLNRLFSLGLNIDNISGFEKQLQDIVSLYPDITRASVIDMNGQIVFHNQTKEMGKMIADKTYLRPPPGHDYALELTDDLYHYYFPVRDNNGQQLAVVAVGSPADVITAKIRQVWLYSTCVAAAVSAVCVLILVILLNLWISRPLKDFIKTIRSVHESGFKQYIKLNSRSNDEIGILVEKFNAMAEEIINSRKKLEDYNKNLEQEVNEKTKKLNDKLKELEKFNKLAVNRELKMIELKKEIEGLKGHFK